MADAASEAARIAARKADRDDLRARWNEYYDRGGKLTYKEFAGAEGVVL